MLRIKKEKDIIASYQFILYGDCNGDGKINSVDLLVLQRQILEIEMLKPYFSKAGNVRKNRKITKFCGFTLNPKTYFRIARD